MSANSNAAKIVFNDGRLDDELPGAQIEQRGPSSSESPRRRMSEGQGGKGEHLHLFMRMDNRRSVPKFEIEEAGEEERYPSRNVLLKRAERGCLENVLHLAEEAFEGARGLCDEDRNMFAKMVKEKLEVFGKTRERMLPPIDLTGRAYKLYPGRVDAVAWLEEHWGEYLTYFGAKRNWLFQDELRKRDPALMAALGSQIGYRNRKGTMRTKLAEIVPSRSARVDELIEGISEEDLKEMTRLVKAKRERLKRKLDS